MPLGIVVLVVGVVLTSAGVLCLVAAAARRRVDRQWSRVRAMQGRGR